MSLFTFTKPVQSKFFLCCVFGFLISCSGEKNTDISSEVENSKPNVDNAAPKAEVLFPWSISRTNAPTIQVKGTASDISGIKEVRVNGNVAELTSINEYKDATWQITIPNESNIVVETEDIHGNVDNEASSVEVLSGPVPISFVIDDVDHQLIGQHKELGKSIVVDLNSNNHHIVAFDSFNDRAKEAYSAKDNLLFRTIMFTNDNLKIVSVDLDTGLSSLDYIYEIAPVSQTEGWRYVKDVDFSQEENTLYILINYNYYNMANKSLILKYDVSAKSASIITDGITASGKKIYSDLVTYTNEGLLVTNYSYRGNYNYTYKGIFKLALDGSEMSKLDATPTITPQLITFDETNNTAYSIGDNGIEKIDLDTGATEIISPDTNENGLSFSQVTSADLNMLNDSLLVSDVDLDMVVAVDLESGSRSKFIHNGVGSGAPMVNPRDFALDDEANIIYIADDGGNGPEVVLAVDLTTGNRKKIGNINNSQNNVFVEGVVLDKDSRTLYVLFEQEIIAIDIASQKTDILSSNNVASGTTLGLITGAILDKSNNRLLVTDAEKNQVTAIDLTTGNRSIISSSLVQKGTGDNLGWINDIVLDSDKQVAYVLSQTSGAVFTIDLNTGNREQLLNSCMNSDGIDKLVADSDNLQNLFFDKAENKLLITAETLLVYNFDSSTCKPSDIQDVFDIAVTNKGQTLASTWKELLQVDTTTGEKVIISK